MSNKSKITVNPFPLGMEQYNDLFRYGHLHQDLQAVSKPFFEMAVVITHQAAYNIQMEFALQQLLVAKDAAVRSYIHYKNPDMKLVVNDTSLNSMIIEYIEELAKDCTTPPRKLRHISGITVTLDATNESDS